MRGVVQLRIHGVGGNPPQKLLGLTPEADVVRVVGDEDAGVYARPSDPHVQGYVWWRLTAGKAIQGAIQGLWILLLPFTLFNVANWMFPERKGRKRRPARVATRALMFLFGLSLTVTYLMWEYELVVKLIFRRWRLGGWLDRTPPNWIPSFVRSWIDHPSQQRTVILGIAGVVIVGIVVLVVATKTRKDFEQFPGPRQRLNPYPEPPVPALGHGLSSPEQLDDPSFWHRPKAAARLMAIHIGTGALVLAGLAVWTIPRADTMRSFGLRPWFIGLAAAQIAMVLLMLVLYFVGWDTKTHFKFAPPIMVASTAVALTTGFFTGFTLWLSHRLDQDRAILDLDQSGAFGIGAVVFAISAVIWFLVHTRTRREIPGVVADIGENRTPAGAEPDGAPKQMVKAIARLRRLSKSLGRIDVLITPSALAFVLAAIALPLIGEGVPHAFVTFGRWELTTLVAIALPALIYRAYKPSENAKVKTLWDATTFWPRRFHPFAVRPYGERAVPELQERLYQLIEKEGKGVVVAAHSQGAVLAYCALIHLVRWRPELTKQVALVTFGNPLHTMHARYFPGYFRHPNDFQYLANRLFKIGNRSMISWANFFHRTDYVGQEAYVGTKRGRDFALPDPAKRPPLWARSLGASWEVPADQPLPIFTRQLVHSYYHNSVELQAWLRIMERRLAR